MILTPRFVFIHLHKSGGSFVNEVLLEHVPGARKLGHHAPASLLPASHAGLPVLGVIRNPWEYYVSWFTFQSERRTWVWQAFSEDGTLDFAATTARMLRAGEDDALIDRLVAHAPVEFPQRQMNLTKACLEGLRGRPFGWYTFLFRRMYADLPVHFLRKENLREALLDFLRKQGIESPALERRVREAPLANATSHAPYRECYDAALARLVSEREREVVTRFGYGF
jgi:hypothetical protein